MAITLKKFSSTHHSRFFARVEFVVAPYSARMSFIQPTIAKSSLVELEVMIHHIPSQRNLLVPLVIRSSHQSPDETVAFSLRIIGIVLSRFRLVECMSIRFQRFEIASAGMKTTARREVKRIALFIEDVLAS